jgi:transcriptional regulator with XRE-family HTH domain
VGSGPPPSARRAQLADFLRARRAALRPEDAGIEPSGRRRTPGLRREEVADLAGVGLSWYTWLEQGREITPSVQVLGALSRALQLSTAGREHLFTLAGVAAPVAQPAPDVDPQLAGLVDALAPHPAFVLDDRFDVVAHNAPSELVVGDLVTAPPERRNLLLWLFDGRDAWPAELQDDWTATARANLLDFRLAHAAHAGEPAFEELLRRLSASSGLFRAWWTEHDVAALEPMCKPMRHPELGVLHLHLLQTRTAGGLRLRMLVPADAATREVFATRFG